MTTIRHTIYRDDDETKIEIEATRCRYGTVVAPDIALSQSEEEAIERALDYAEADDWDEAKWQAEREMAS